MPVGLTGATITADFAWSPRTTPSTSKPPSEQYVTCSSPSVVIPTRNTWPEHRDVWPTAYVELLTPEPFDLTTFPNDEGYDELVVVRDISFSSLCQHHLLPFHGVAHVGYLPAERILGLSKLARIVKMFAADFQTQERLTMQVASWLDKHLATEGCWRGHRSRPPMLVLTWRAGRRRTHRHLGGPWPA